MDTSELIDQLSQELKPVTRARKPYINLLYWGLSSIILVALLSYLSGPLRTNVSSQLLGSSRFLLECIIGLLLGTTAAYASLNASIPGAALSRGSKILTVSLLLLWVALYLYGIEHPALPASMAGKRPNCLFEALAFACVPFALLLRFVRQGTALSRRWNAALIGIAAASLPALAMNLVCMYDPMHILQFHLSTIGICGAVGLALANIILPTH